jgi:hypothetical protein
MSNYRVVISALRLVSGIVFILILSTPQFTAQLSTPMTAVMDPCVRRYLMQTPTLDQMSLNSIFQPAMCIMKNTLQESLPLY